MPSIEIRLAPPEDPLPQVSATIQLLERQRMNVQEAMMSKLEDVFNKMLDESQTRIQESVEKAMKVFEDRKLLDQTISAELLPLTSPNKNKDSLKAAYPRFQELDLPDQDPHDAQALSQTSVKIVEKVQPSLNSRANNTENKNGPIDARKIFEEPPSTASQSTIPSIGPIEQLSLSVENAKSEELDAENVVDKDDDKEVSNRSHAPLNASSRLPTSFLMKEGAARFPLSFLQLSSTSNSKGVGDAVKNVMNRMANAAAPMVNVEVVDVFEPDASIENKMKQIEQKRNDEEGQMFELAAEELEQLTKITIQELDKNIQLQMNAFLVDRDAVGGSLAAALKNSPLLGGKTKKVTRFQQIRKVSVDEPTPSDADEIMNFGFPRVSFLQLSSKSRSAADQSNILNPEQLNVKVGATDRPYPTVDELVDDMEKKRDATERLERAKILELQLRLMRAQGEMIKDTLHHGVARVLALVGQTAESIKAEMAGASQG